MTKRMVFMILGLVLVFGGVFGWQLYRGHLMAQYFALFVVPTMHTYLAKNRTVQVQATGEVGGKRPATTSDLWKLPGDKFSRTYW